MKLLEFGVETVQSVPYFKLCLCHTLQESIADSSTLLCTVPTGMDYGPVHLLPNTETKVPTTTVGQTCPQNSEHYHTLEDEVGSRVVVPLALVSLEKRPYLMRVAEERMVYLRRERPFWGRRLWVLELQYGISLLFVEKVSQLIMSNELSMFYRFNIVC